MNERMRVNLCELLPIIEEQLAAEKEVCFSPQGESMLPLLVPDRDSVVLISPPVKLKKYDLPLYRRTGGQFVLHRVVKAAKDGTYVMCGDNQFTREKGIKHNQIIGIVTSFSRNGKQVNVRNPIYKLYCVYIVKKRRLQKLYVKVKNKISRISGK